MTSAVAPSVRKAKKKSNLFRNIDRRGSGVGWEYKGARYRLRFQYDEPGHTRGTPRTSYARRTLVTTRAILEKVLPRPAELSAEAPTPGEAIVSGETTQLGVDTFSRAVGRRIALLRALTQVESSTGYGTDFVRTTWMAYFAQTRDMHIIEESAARAVRHATQRVIERLVAGPKIAISEASLRARKALATAPFHRIEVAIDYLRTIE